MKFPGARCFGFVAVVSSVMLAALTVGCETEPEPAVSVTGVWMGLEVPDTTLPVSALRWELALVDVPPDSIWGSARSQNPEYGPEWSLATPLKGWRDGTSVVLQWLGRRYEAEVSLGEDAPEFMTGDLFLGNYQRIYAQLSVEKTP